MLHLINYKIGLFFFFLVPIINLCQAQNFVNGDLEGEISGLSSLPDFWDAVPFMDINCLAGDVQKATPNLVSATEPFADFGLPGIPYSGNTFVSGLYSDANDGLFFHEGIMQSVSGFIPGNSYRISFFQSVSRGYLCRDTSGSWAVFLNDSLLGVSTPSSSQISYMSINLEWEEREISFTAMEDSYLIKFLPWDDDLIHLCDSTIVDGGLGMGIDHISIEDLSTSTEENILRKTDITIYPNPTSKHISINLKGHERFKEIQILDTDGRVVKKYLSLQSRQEEIGLPNAAGLYLIKIVTDKSNSIHKVLKL